MSISYASALMIWVGSALMIYNIYLYIRFDRQLQSRGNWAPLRRVLRLPILLLIGFLIGYLWIALFGHKDIMIGSILLGGSIFVWLMILFLQAVTARLQENVQLESRLEAAEESARAKSGFLSNMSHEMRTPMNAIIGLNRMVLRDPTLSAETRENVEKCGSFARHLLSLINEILDMSRIESGRMEIRQEPFSLAELLGQVNAIIEIQCREKGLTFRPTVLDVDHDAFRGDELKLKQVLINILGNAVKFTNPPGTVSFTVRQTGTFDDYRTLRFTMQDTGIGMDKEYLPKIFEVFSQEDATTTNRYGGSGLGLAITKSLVELMNGEITVESQKGVGTTFTVTVTLCALPEEPAAESLPEESASPDASVPAERPEGALKGLHVLLAEDVDINADILTDLLDMEGVTARRAENGQIALELMGESAPGEYDAILMDIRMPVLDGLGAARAIRELDRPDAKTVPIIALTANAFDEDVQRSLQAGMNAHLTKPVDPDLLYETLWELTRK